MSSYEDKADSYNYDPYSDGLKNGGAALRVRDGDARHIAMKSIRMKAAKSISQINSYAESHKKTLYIKNWLSLLPAGIPAGKLEHLNFGEKQRFVSLGFTCKKGDNVGWAQPNRKRKVNCEIVPSPA